MRRLIWAVLFVLLMLLQGALSVFYTGWLSCDLPLLALYCFAMLRGEIAGAAMGFYVGFLQDAMTVGIFGFHCLTRTIIGFLVGLTKEKVFKENIYYHITAIACCSFALRFFFWWLELIRSGGRWDIFGSYLWTTLGYMIGNMLLVIPMSFVVRKIYNWVKEHDISY